MHDTRVARAMMAVELVLLIGWQFGSDGLAPDAVRGAVLGSTSPNWHRADRRGSDACGRGADRWL